MNTIKIKKLHPNAITPTYATDGSACFDLFACTVSSMGHIGDLVYPGHPVVCGTGLAFEVPAGYVMAIKSRSGLAFKHGVFAFPGEIDSDFRGEVKVLLMCPELAEEEPPTKINPGDRIAQARLVAAPKVAFEVVDELSTTERGVGGFGSSGV